MLFCGLERIEIINNQLIPFSFEGIALKESCWLEGKPYFTRRAIGEWLGYPHPRQAIEKIIKRNPHIKQFSVVPKLGTTDGKSYEQEVYDPIGLQLIINKSDKPKAIQFQVTVAHLVVAFLEGKLKPVEPVSPTLSCFLEIPPHKHGNGKLIEAAMKTTPRFNKRSGSQKPPVSIGTVYHRLRDLRAGKPLKPNYRIPPPVSKALEAKVLPFLEYLDQHPGVKGVELARRFGISRRTVCYWKKKLPELRKRYKRDSHE